MKQAEDKWYYTIVQNPGTDDEAFVGYTGTEKEEKFIPVFKDKKSAEQCFTLMPKDIFKEKYEVQAVIEEDVLSAAKTTRHKIYLLNERGKILELLN